MSWEFKKTGKTKGRQGQEVKIKTENKDHTQKRRKEGTLTGIMPSSLVFSSGSRARDNRAL